MKRKIANIIVHCSATPNGKDFRAKDIDNMHRNRGFNRRSHNVSAYNSSIKHVGYHYVICLDGVIEAGRGVEEIGAHVKGSNTNSIGICMVGLDKYTKAQWDSLRELVIALTGLISGNLVFTVDDALSGLKEMNVSLKGHRDYSPDLNGDGQITREEWMKDCPNFTVFEWTKGGMVAIKDNLL
jgi:N-acetylmuramoyl-L-alanine amidase